MEKIAGLKSHMFDVLNIIDSATVREDIDKFVKLREDAMFALKRLLPNLPQRSRTTVARRPAGDAQKNESQLEDNSSQRRWRLLCRQNPCGAEPD